MGGLGPPILFAGLDDGLKLILRIDLNKGYGNPHFPQGYGYAFLPMSQPSDKAKLDLYLTHRRALIDYARPILGCRSQAEDVVQEAYLRFDGLSTGRSLDEPTGFLYRIVRNLAVDWARRMGREGKMVAAVDCQDVAEEGPSPETQALQRDQLQVVMAALDELPERTRRAVRLHRLDGMTLTQVADQLGISVGLAHSLVCDGIAHCRQRLRARS